MSNSKCHVIKNIGYPHVRWMIRKDTAAVVAVDRGVDFTCISDVAEFARMRNCICSVCEIHDRVVGFMIYLLEKDHLQLTHLVVDADYTRKRIGSFMLDWLKGKLANHKRRRGAIRMEVPEYELPALLFLKANGFRAKKIIKPFMDDQDGILMEFKSAD